MTLSGTEQESLYRGQGLGFVMNQRPKIIIMARIYPSLHTDDNWMLMGCPEMGVGGMLKLGIDGQLRT